MPDDPTSTAGPRTAHGATRRDPTADLVRMGVLHAALVLVPVFVLAVLILHPLLAVVVALAVAVAVTVWRCRDIDARLARALAATPLPDGAEARLQSLNESVSMAVGVAPPVLHRIEDDAANAIVWGSGTATASLAVTTGLLARLDRLGLEGVLARLLVDIRDGVVEGPSVAAVLFGPLARGPFADVLPRVARTTADPQHVLAGDLEAVRCIQYPSGLADVLEILASTSTDVVRIPDGSRPLWLVSPGAPPSAGDVTFPPVIDRVDVVREF